MSEELAVLESTTLATNVAQPLDVGALKARVAAIEQIIEGVMTQGVHYGPPYPGSDKDSLLQAGAEMMLMSFSTVAEPLITEEKLEGDHRRYICTGWLSTADGTRIGSATAECSTMEPKYRWRKGGRVCPACGSSDALLRSKNADPQTGLKGWFCWTKKGGCGENYPPEHPEITEQQVGRVENKDLAELWHTCRRMAEKRWLVAITRRTFALSARFVDAEAAQNARFDLKRAAGLLRSLPGEKAAKWRRCIAWSLQTFGKAPKDLTNLEGDAFLRWLGDQIDDATQLTAADFGDSPELAEKPAAEPVPPPAAQAVEAASKAHADNTVLDAEASQQRLDELQAAVKAAGIEDAIVEAFGLPGAPWELNRAAILGMVDKAEDES